MTDAKALSDQDRGLKQSDVIMIALFAILIAAICAGPVYTLFAKVPKSYDEGWNAYHAVTAMRGGQLYDDRNGFISVTYPPLSFYIVGLFSKVFHDSIFVGRVVALVCLFATAINVGLIARCLGARTVFACLSVALFLFSVSSVAFEYIAMDDRNGSGIFS